jgi:chaperonin GroES
MKIKPLFNNVLIKPLEAEEKTPGGILLPDSAKEKPQIGEIMAIGDGDITPKGDQVKIVVKVGQKVMYKAPSFGPESATEVKVNGEDWVIIDQRNIVAIVE